MGLGKSQGISQGGDKSKSGWNTWGGVCVYEYASVIEKKMQNKANQEDGKNKKPVYEMWAEWSIRKMLLKALHQSSTAAQ